MVRYGGSAASLILMAIGLWLMPGMASATQTSQQVIPLPQGEIRVQTELSTTTPWVREAILIRMQAITPDRFASLAIEPSPLPGFELIPLAAERDYIDTPDGPRTRLRIGLALYALTAGVQKPALPAVHYRLSGGTRERLSLPQPELTVKALPPYVPPTMPVGRVAIHSQVDAPGWPGNWLNKGEMGFWHITLQADAVPAGWLPPLSSQLTASEAIRLLPADSTADQQGVHARVDYRVPFTPLANGRAALPELRLQYFDPHTARLEWVSHRPARPLVLGLPLRLVLAAGLLAFVLWSAHKLSRWTRRRYGQWRERRAALNELMQASNTAGLRTALRRYAAAQHGAANLTLTQWHTQHPGKLPEELFEQLQQASYAGDHALGVEELRSRLHAALSGS